MKNEKTGKAPASIAGKILKLLSGKTTGLVFYVGPVLVQQIGTVEDIRKVCASALTQAPDKAKKKR